MSITTITPIHASTLLGQGALLIDIRAADEFARERIAQAKNIPLDTLSRDTVNAGGDCVVIFHCRSGMRTQANADRLANAVAGDALVLEGGIDGWKNAQLPVVKDASQPLELQRQVQIGAGSLALAGFVMGMTVSPYFHALSGFVGAGLLMAGITGFCGLARVLMQMPWNKR